MVRMYFTSYSLPSTTSTPRSKGLTVAFTVLLFLITNRCFALSDDHLQITHLQAGSADLNQQTHRGIYLHNVQLDQGTTHIHAARAITEGNAKNQLIKAIISGNKTAQAHYWTLTTPDKPPLHAYADTMYYYPERHTIELIGHAKVEQGDDSFAAPKISYDTLHQLIISNKDNKNRTMIILHQGINHE
jgi:lipopolysaccharide export system protein LptA